MVAYPAKLTSDEDGRFMVSFRDVPGALTGGETCDEALAQAPDCLATALEHYEGLGDVPAPTEPQDGEVLVEPKFNERLKIAIIGSGSLAADLASMLTGMTTKHDLSKDPVDLPPVMEGVGGRAWLMDVEKGRAGLLKGQVDATVAVWIIEAPWAHPVWHSYAITLVHLRPVPEFGEPVIHVPGATHEFVLHALNPDVPRAPQITTEKFLAFMTPANFAAQMVCATDAEAMAVVETAVRAVVDGKLNPDTDAIRQWAGVFGDAMMRKG